MSFTPALKDPVGRAHLRFEFGRPAGMDVTGIVSVTITPAGRVEEVAPLVVAAQHAGLTYALVSVEGGTDGELYLVECVVTTGDGEYPQRQELLCIDLSWRIPGVALPAYVSITDFVTRAGLDLTITLTDEDRRGAIDAERLERALLDAQAVVHSYLAGRHQVPLDAPVPEPVPTIVYDLAVARLYREDLPEQFAEREKMAMRLLADLSSGKAQLATAAAPSATPAGPILTAGRETIFTRDSMRGF